MSSLLLTFNAGSSTVKIGIFALKDEKPTRIGKAVVDFATRPLTLKLTEGPTQFDVALSAADVDDLSELMKEVFDALGDHFNLKTVVAAGHRIVHGGTYFTGPAMLDTNVMKEINALVKLAPLHQPQALRLMRAVRHLRPSLFQTASFDTTFHTSQSDLVRRLAIPRTYHDQGVKRYGFHGLSYQYVARALAHLAPEMAAGRKIVIAHLGSGASLCGIENGASRDCSMGFSTLDGIPMATRPGWIDPGVVLHFLGPMEKSLHDVENLLYHQSGLFGVSGLSGDIRHLWEDDGPEAREAIELFILRIAGEVCRLASTLGGLDAIVFTAGIGENQPKIRERIVERLHWLGAGIDRDANEKNAPRLHTEASRIAVYVIPTDEEQMIAEECQAIFTASSASTDA